MRQGQEDVFKKSISEKSYKCEQITIRIETKIK